MENLKNNSEFLMLLFQNENKIKDNIVLEDFIYFFKEIINYGILEINDFVNLDKNKILSWYFLSFMIKDKIDLIFYFNFKIKKTDILKNSLFNLSADLSIEKKIFFLFKETNFKNVLFFSKKEIKEMSKQKNNFILFNFFIGKNEIIMDALNLKDIFNLYKINEKDWNNIEPNFVIKNKDAYVTHEEYLKYKKIIKNFKKNSVKNIF